MRIHRLSAAGLLLAGPVFLAANLTVAIGWRHPAYRWATDNISDLGNVTCGRWDTTRPRLVCSPWHVGMDVALVITGLLLGLGVLLAGPALGRGPALRSVQTLVAAAAGGYVLAGLYPADVNENTHFLAALLIFGPGNLGLVVAAAARRSPVLASLRAMSLLLGLVAVAGTVLFFAQVDLGFGVGGMERVAVFPLLVWSFAAGVQILRLGEVRRTGPALTLTGR